MRSGGSSIRRKYLEYLGFSFGQSAKTDPHPSVSSTARSPSRETGIEQELRVQRSRQEARRVRLVMSELAKGCEHFLEYRQNHGLQSFKIIYKYLVKPGQEARKLKAKTCVCHVCHCFTPRLHTCLMCVYFGCMNPDNHMRVHVKSAGHPLAVDLNYGTVFCFKCRDYIYDASLDEICREIDQQLAHKKYHISRQPVAYVAWEPTKSEMELLKQNPKRRRVEPNSTVGLRGLYNLGNTCFMNCIVQALAHTPILRDYFLSDRHRCFLDTMQQRCVVCEMGNLFQEFYSGVSSPYIPFKLLHLVWTHARHLAGYEQQDAHEFFIAVLDVLHHHSGGQTPTVTQPGHCSCIVDQTYNGRLQSDVQCQTCKSVSTTVDPFRDISLDLAPSMVTNRTSTPVETNDIQSDRASPASSTNSGETLLSAVPATLYECLDRFTRPESLGSESKIKCNKCRSYQESTKKLSVKKLPIVTCFHLKRFEHSMRSRKIANYIQFDLEIDLTSYMARTSESSDNRYSLFAVVNHSGSLFNGHYTCFVRQQQDQWYKCDDAWITKATPEEVLSSEGYLLFYHKKVLEYS